MMLLRFDCTRSRPFLFAGLLSVLISLSHNACTAEPAVSPDPVAVDLTIGSWADVQKRVAAARGRIVVVNIWTTTCGTCREEFPDYVDLRKLGRAGELTLLDVACDYDGIEGKPPEYYRGKVATFLREHQPKSSDHFLLNQPFADFLEELKLNSTPAVIVYDRNGKQLRRFDNDAAKKIEDEFTMKDVRAFVEPLLMSAK